MSLTEREDLVHYWVHNSVPVFEMFQDFTRLFDDRTAREKFNRNLAGLEIDEESVKTGLQILEHLYPDHYKALEEKFNEEFLYVVVRKRGKIDHFVRGKSYHKEAPE
jgi:hypothetical protein